MNTNPYAPPKAAVADVESFEESPPLWNPNSACLWSLLFSPAFGAYLHMKNWEALGESDKAATSRKWVIGVIVLLIALPVLVVLAATIAPGVRSTQNLWGLVTLLAWYISVGRSQIDYVKERFGKKYPRRGWGKPLGIAVLAAIGYFVIAGMLGVIVEALLSLVGAGIWGGSGASGH